MTPNLPTLEEVTQTILLAVHETLSPAEEVSENTALFGGASEFDSIAVVSLLAEVEQRINDRYATSVTIADERAMSQKRSPFRNVRSLAEYILQLVSEQRGNPA